MVSYHSNPYFWTQDLQQNGRGRERRTKRRFDSGGANQDESGSSGTKVISGRELRPREKKRAATATIDDIVEESEHTSSMSSIVAIADLFLSLGLNSLPLITLVPLEPLSS